MRIKVENINSEDYYDAMPEKQRRFLGAPLYFTYENGNHYIIFFPKARNAYIRIGFDRMGYLYLEPRIWTKTGKVAMREEDLKNLFAMIVVMLQSASENGFLDTGDADG